MDERMMAFSGNVFSLGAYFVFSTANNLANEAFQQFPTYPLFYLSTSQQAGEIVFESSKIDNDGFRQPAEPVSNPIKALYQKFQQSTPFSLYQGFGANVVISIVEYLSMIPVSSLSASFFPGNTVASCGLLGATFLITWPLRVAHVRMVTNKDHFHYSSLWSSLTQIYRREGFTGLYRGVFPYMLTRGWPSATPYLINNPNFPLNSIRGLFYNLLSLAITHPFNLIATRMALFPTNHFELLSNYFAGKPSKVVLIQSSDHLKNVVTDALDLPVIVLIGDITSTEGKEMKENFYKMGENVTSSIFCIQHKPNFDTSTSSKKPLKFNFYKGGSLVKELSGLSKGQVFETVSGLGGLNPELENFVLDNDPRLPKQTWIQPKYEYPSTISTIKSVYKNDGLLGFFSGVLPMLGHCAASYFLISGLQHFASQTMES